ncbi:copper chaperone CopZ [Metabacillus malikii]|uniref:Copper chaperone CopZ n=1 Tax=Metabacillus malikii TaxID=1504265 RepID=A0ABT9ZBL8_9BACI|nr:copper chaperone CopZ [Metabacillus malikii]MDQ0229649.1 copper chaperone [Metabacillus malikii]
METKTYKVEGMSCQHCVNAVEGSVSKLAGVQAVKVILDKGEVEVSFDHEKVTNKEIVETIEEQGYDVV